ncbi:MULTISPECIES: 2Fe-2S iron-sulfur cluster-binding protein [Rhodococcus]|uniref:(2Fe-2S)-binding protein n=1 Tax=Rhodococcus aetherivorans TaxID=191292 RepID=N1MD79_9NOCA|nr:MULTISPECIES: 2Fe-2S iron-sulfur cluster-binding protein [Rhodococcus]KDE11694.1 reductase [Rhodococcus aetherivorans]MDV6294028.1 2Fe-2S iron-sulfur cluster-binding protein [Rhodococcus aetherivorans]PND53453.1 (2Fe-2S)-binding protein [Rhodococcus sp. ENV425]QRI77852.1 (2Fe-2S)-binding protein [Rhodococcus aetherivorans]QSE61268.1 (2Fe-2S)-binding protein [Rhodococcus sp. PSBB066]
MTKVTYHLPDGTSARIDVEPGETLMNAALRNNLPGIVAECGGSCACATCHVHLPKKYSYCFTPPTDEETDLIAYLDAADDESRLSCQLVVDDSDNEIHIRVADSR